jgi:2-dehydro-3-deoxyphosphogluconate aldolase/(4S)-4-hydroxy-2-oxoglutarate aldolase
MGTTFNPDLFKKLPVVGILRFFKKEEIEKLIPASMEGGLCNIEVTMNSEGALDQIKLAREIMGDKGNVGAGTVTGVTELETALRAGAQFIVTPAVFPDLIRICAARGVPMMPGAMTPTEVLTAWKAGPPTMVKVFPADQLGPAHIKALKGPFPQIPLMPTGGVTVETLPAFKKAGADAFGVGGPLFDPKQVAAGNWDWFREQAARFVEAWKSA